MPKIKPLADISFESSVIDYAQNSMHVQAKNLLDVSGQNCQCEGCHGSYIAHGYSTAVYEDTNIDGYRVFIHLKSQRFYCPKCGSVIVLKPACLARDTIQIGEETYGNHRMTNRFLDWIEYLTFKYDIDIVAELTHIKKRRLYYIRRAAKEQLLNLHIESRSVVVAKSRHNNKIIYLIIDTLHDDQLLNFVNSPKKAFEYVKNLKANNPNIEQVVIPAGFKFKDELINLFGDENVKYDYRSLRTMITKCCFKAYSKGRDKEDALPIEIEEKLFCTPRTLLSREEQEKLDSILRSNRKFHDFYYMQREYWTSLGEKFVLHPTIQNKDLEKLEKELEKAKSKIEHINSLDSIAHELDSSLFNKESKEYILYKQRIKSKKDVDAKDKQIISLNVDQD